jgi:hypothetical protein
MKRLVYPAVSLTVALAVGIYASIALGRFTVAALFLVFTTLALMWVVWLMFRAAQAMVSEPEAEDVARATGRRRKELEREKQSLLKALKELEFDHEMRKISDVDYQEIGGNYRARAVRVLKQLDQTGKDVDYRVLVERDVAARLKAKSEAKAEAGGEPEAQGEAKPEAKADAKADAKSEAKPEPKPEKVDDKPACPTCGTANDLDAEFCKKCGKKLTAAEAVQ